jgi:VWFA-related protein
VGFVSTGSTAIAIDPSYDYEHRKFNDVIDRVVGSAPKPDDYINEAWFEGQQGPPGLRQAASQAFGTAYDMIEQLSKIVDRRKAFIYVSDGYTFDPFTDARFQNIERQYEEYSGQADQPQRNNAGQIVDSNGQVIDPQMSDTPPPPKQSELTPDNPLADARYRERTMWKESELIAEEADLTRTANRANVTFYTIDPRGLITGMDAGMSNKIEYPDLRRFIDTQANSLKVLAEETGGLAIVGMNDFVKWIQRIDAETSDSYTIGYQSTNPDPLKVKRTIKIEVTRPTVATLLYRHDYTIQKTSRK